MCTTKVKKIETLIIFSKGNNQQRDSSLFHVTKLKRLKLFSFLLFLITDETLTELPQRCNKSSYFWELRKQKNYPYDITHKEQQKPSSFCPVLVCQILLRHGTDKLKECIATLDKQYLAEHLQELKDRERLSRQRNKRMSRT